MTERREGFRRQYNLSLKRWLVNIVMLSVLAWVVHNGYTWVSMVLLDSKAQVNTMSDYNLRLTRIANGYSHTWLAKKSPNDWLLTMLHRANRYLAFVLGNAKSQASIKTKFNEDLRETKARGTAGHHHGLFPDVYVDQKSKLFWKCVSINTHRVLLKITLLLAMLPWFGLSFLIGLTDGLVQRAIRKYELGRESTFIFHKLGGWLLKISLLIWFLYLIADDELNPLLCFIPMGILLGLYAYTMCSRFKKYL